MHSRTSSAHTQKECISLDLLIINSSSYSATVQVAHRLSGIRRARKNANICLHSLLLTLETAQRIEAKRREKKTSHRTNCLINISLNLVSYSFFFSLVWLPLLLHLNGFFVPQSHSHGYDFRIANAIFGRIVMWKCSCDGKNIPKEFRFDCFKCVFFLDYYFVLSFIFMCFLLLFFPMKIFLAVHQPFQNRRHI